MAIEICPLAADVGNVADWAGVAVGFAAAVGTVVVAIAANRTSRKAATIAEDAKRIAQQQHDEAIAAREASARIVVRLLLHEISELPLQLALQIERCDRTISVDSEGVIKKPHLKSVARAFEAAGRSFLPGTEQVLDRIHNLRDEIGDDLATLVGYNRTLNQLSKDFAPMLKVQPGRGIGGRDTFVYTGNERDIAIFRKYLAMFLELAIDFANRFRAYGDAELHDYSRYKALLVKET